GDMQGGMIGLAATSWLNVEASGEIKAQSHSGGDIALSADVFVNAGQIHADGGSAGQIVVQARNVLNAGPITADGTISRADGGVVHVLFTEAYVGTTAGWTTARGAHGGSVAIDGGATGHLFSSGR